jgi:hypothetical protein
MHAHYIPCCSNKLEPETAGSTGGLSEISVVVAALMDGSLTVELSLIR